MKIFIVENKMDTNLSSKETLDEDSNSVDNGLDPLGIELISSSLEIEQEIQPKENSTEIVSTEEDVATVEIQADEEPESTQIEVEEVEITISKPSSPELVVTSSNISTPQDDTATVAPKMSREMRNLQKSTKDSKVLSTFLLTDGDSPRVRRKANLKEFVSPNESDSLINEMSVTIDSEVPLKDVSPENDDSDCTVVVRDEVPRKRRRSISRTAHRSKSVAVRARPKSMSRMLTDEMAATSDKDDNREDDDFDDMTGAISIMKSIENRAPNPPPKPGWDSFCFKCHLDNAVLSLACKNCKCSFHRHCARLLYTPIPKNPDDFICADCIDIKKITDGQLNKYDHPKIDPFTLKEMLMTILEKVRTYPDRECYENEIYFSKSTKESNQPLIIAQMSLKIIEDRIVNNYYKVSEAFLHDMKQLEHNWMIVDKNKTKSLKNILKFVVTEINEMEACVHCYSSSFVISNWFTIPCKKPHLLIWAKLKGYPYWPAKVMSIDNQKLYADVRFFGAHDRAWVPAAQCLIFSEKDPNKIGKATTPTNPNPKNASKSQKGIADAMKEKDEYIENVREKYGFRFAQTRETLDPNMYQKQLEAQLPSLSTTTNGADKIDNDHNQKEKLTLKIVKASDGTQTIEQRTPRIVHEKERHILYTVLSKNEEGAENADQSKVKTLILKRNKQIDAEKAKNSKKGHAMDDSETSESIVSIQEVKSVVARRKSIRDVSKTKKAQRNIESRSVTPEPSRKKAKTNGENVLALDVPEKQMIVKKTRKSIFYEKDAQIVSNQKIPAGTHEIHSLRESPSSSTRSKQARYNRSKSVDKESSKNDEILRRLSINSTNRLSRDSSTPKQMKTPQRSAPVRKSTLLRKKPSIHPDYDPDLIIKDEEMSEEEIVQREHVTVNDLPNLVNEGSSKRKTIVISTSDNSNDSFPQNSRARKSFPNRLVDTLHAPQIRNTNAMVCIPKVFPATEKPESQMRMVNGTHEPLNERMSLTPSSSVQSSNSVEIVGQSGPRVGGEALPRLVPRPTGVFTCEGTSFQSETGAIGELFSENAHRMTDYFKSLLIDTIGAVASGVSDAQNVLLKLESEKLKQQMNNLKVEHQMKIDKIKKDHVDELRLMKLTYEEKLKNVQQNYEQDRLRMIKDIRQQCEIDKQRAIEVTKREVKRQTWCSHCTKQARFYCCWNTSYCGQTCQKSHWETHKAYCTNRNSSIENNTQNSNVNNSSKQHQQMTVGNETPTSKTPPNSAFIPVTISLTNTSNKQLLRTIALPQPAQQALVHQSHGTVLNSLVSSASPDQPQPLRINPQGAPPTHQLIHPGQKTLVPTYVHQQHKISPTIATKTSEIIGNPLTRESVSTIPITSFMREFTRNAPPLTLITTPATNANHMSDSVTSSTMTLITAASLGITTVSNESQMNHTSKT